MEILHKLETLEKSIDETDKLIEELISNLKDQKIKLENKEKKISYLKRDVSDNVDKIDKILENYNANS